MRGSHVFQDQMFNLSAGFSETTRILSSPVTQMTQAQLETLQAENKQLKGLLQTLQSHSPKVCLLVFITQQQLRQGDRTSLKSLTFVHLKSRSESVFKFL